ncbi:family 1 glycosylhydrolase, partial [Rhizobium johnstonii]
CRAAAFSLSERKAIANSSPPASDVKTDIGWEIYATGLKLSVEDLYRSYELPECYITENGACDNTDVVDGEVDDTMRLD